MPAVLVAAWNDLPAEFVPCPQGGELIRTGVMRSDHVPDDFDPCAATISAVEGDQRFIPPPPTLPENQLRFYIHFSAPMSRARRMSMSS